MHGSLAPAKNVTVAGSGRLTQSSSSSKTGTLREDQARLRERLVESQRTPSTMLLTSRATSARASPRALYLTSKRRADTGLVLRGDVVTGSARPRFAPVQTAVGRHLSSSRTARSSLYEATIPNLRIHKDTRVRAAAPEVLWDRVC